VLFRSKRSQRNPATEYYISRLLAAGGTLTESQENALNDFANSVDSDGTRGKLIRCGLFLGGFSGITVPFINGPTNGVAEGDVADTNSGYLSSDLILNGLVGGGNSSTKIITCGNVLGTNFTTSNVGYGAIGYFTRPDTNFHGIRDSIGFRISQTQVRGLTDTPVSNLFAQWNSTIDPLIGSLHVNAISSTDAVFYYNSTLTTNVTSRSTSAFPSTSIAVAGSITSVGTNAISMNGIESVYWLTRGATHAESVTIASKLLTLSRALGRTI
jgi:hypothetical protein